MTFYKTLVNCSSLKTPAEILDLFRYEFPLACNLKITPISCLMEVARDQFVPWGSLASDKELSEVSHIIYSLISKYRITDNSIRSACSFFRNLAIPLGEEKSKIVNSIIRLPEERMIALNKEQKQKTEERSENVRMIKGLKVRSIMEYLGESELDLMIYIMIATGRRFIEMFIGSFELPETEEKYPTLLFGNKAKSKDKSEWAIPVIGLSQSKQIVEEDILRRIMKLRVITLKLVDEIKERYPEWKSKLSSFYSNKLNKRVSELFGEGWTSHDLRRVYGQVIIKMYNKNGLMADLSFLKRALGHSDFSSSIHYINIRVI